MNKLDNIAKAIEEGSSKAKVQQETEQSIEQARTETTQIDRVGQVEAEDKEASEQGFVGSARTVGAVEPEPVARREFTGTESEFCLQVQGAIESINTYEAKMGNASRVTPAIIDDQQARLYNAIMTILKTEKNSDFIGGMEFLFRKFRSDDRGAFSGDLIRRRINYMKRPQGDTAMLAYTGFLDLLSVFSEPMNRKVLWPRFNRKAVLAILPDASQRQRLETYMNRIAA